MILIEAPMVVDSSLVGLAGAGGGVFATEAGEALLLADSCFVLKEFLGTVVVFGDLGVLSNICKPMQVT